MSLNSAARFIVSNNSSRRGLGVVMEVRDDIPNCEYPNDFRERCDSYTIEMSPTLFSSADVQESVYRKFILDVLANATDIEVWKMEEGGWSNKLYRTSDTSVSQLISVIFGDTTWKK